MSAQAGTDLPDVARRPIFIHGILGRSGTNYLARLLDLHPDCQLSPLPEDWLLAESHHIRRFAEAIGARWRHNPGWDIPPDLEAQLLQRLGAAMLSFLNEGIKGKRLVTKTPNVQWLEHFFALFPEASLLILIRDGRSVVESAKRSFGNDPYQVARWWAWAAQQILRFDRANRGRSRYRLVRYEDLVTDTEAELTRILETLDLDPDEYDFSQLRSLPVFGSCTSLNEAGQWEWMISPATPGAGQLQRWQAWSRQEHERFNWIAAQALQGLGYEPRKFAEDRTLWSLRTVLWAMLQLLRRAGARLLDTRPARRLLTRGHQR